MKNTVEITSVENPLIKLVCGLQSSAKVRKQNGLFVLEGLRICRDAYENAVGFDKLIVTQSALQKYGEELERFSCSAVQTVIVSERIFKKMSDTDTPQGVIALAAVPEQKGRPSPKGRYIALENIADPSNLGAVSRTAEALGVTGIILSGGCEPYSPKSLRASMGTLLRMPVYITDDIIDFAKQNGLRTFACVVDRDALPVQNTAFCDGDMIIIGNEANGITESTKAQADERITIRMAGKAESLNAAAAAAIVMWEMRKGSTV